MQSEAWIKQSCARLQQAGIETARLDLLVLLEDATGKDRTQLLAHPELELSKVQQNVLNAQVARRVQHEPLAYIRGKCEFYGREFVVSPAVLVPRPESETMITLLLQATLDLPTPRIADIGAGSGALGITAQIELPRASVELLDISPDALKVAKSNVIKHTTSIHAIESNLLADATQEYDILLCNLPYVPDEYSINQAATHEPNLALFGGQDGLDVYRSLFTQITNLQNKPLLILTESLPDQHGSLQLLARSAGYSEAQKDDFIQVFKLED